jgi:hypothetical protein
VLIWPTFTANEIRVSLYSTKWVAEVKPNGQDTRQNGSCTVFVSKRQRTFLDGRVVNDSTRAQYRAGEGQNCGDEQAPDDPPTTKPAAAVSTTTKPPPASTTTTKKPPATTATTRRATP